MEPIFPTFEDIRAAAARLDGVAVRTPLVRCDALDAAVGARVLVKPECLQLTGSFKIRGAYNRLAQMTDAQRATGVVAYSSGNHAQGVAEAARRLNMPAVIVAPSDAPATKLEGVRERGAELVLYDRHTQNREEIARTLADQNGAVLVPSYDDPHIVAGQGTAALEAIEDAAALDIAFDKVWCCVGGGGLIAGVGLAFEALSPATKIWGAEPEGHDDTARSLEAGERLANAPGARSICDALLSPEPGALTFPMNQQRLAGVGVVDDDEIRAAVRFAFQHLKLVVEPGGAAALAALLSGKADIQAGEDILVVITGGNVDPAMFGEILAGAA